MSGYAPQAIYDCYDTIHASIPDAINAGIYGPQPGYHGSRNDQHPSDYSVQLPQDQEGDPDAGAALDVTMYDDADMSVCTQRLIDAAEARDPRLRGLRSFFGTVDGYTVTGRNVNPDVYPVTSDPSHLFHVHLSGLREFATDHDAWQDIAAVFTGGGQGNGGINMTTRARVTKSTDQPLTGGEAEILGFDDSDSDLWDPDSPNALQLSQRNYISTVYLEVQGLDGDHSISVQTQEMSPDGSTHNDPRSEYRGTGGNTGIALSTVGYCGKGAKIRVRVSAGQDVTILSADWIVLY